MKFRSRWLHFFEKTSRTSAVEKSLRHATAVLVLRGSLRRGRKFALAPASQVSVCVAKVLLWPG